jgi:ABC-type glycerol-3-phosphate transport system substrate-binding protein
MKRRSILLGTAGSLPASFLAACGAVPDAAPGAATEKTVQLTYLHTWTPQQGHGPATDRLVARFREQFPTIQVEASGGQGGDVYYQKLTALLAGGDLPDVVSSKVEYLPFMVSRQVVVSPETLAKGQLRIDKNDLVPVSREFATFDGKLMAAPYILSSQGIVFNQTLFRQAGLDPDKPPTTWAEVVETGKRLSGGSGETETWGMQLPRQVQAQVPYICLLWQNGGEPLDLAKRVVTWNTPAGVEALEYWVDLVHKHRVGALQQPANPFRLGRAGLWQLPVGSVSIVQGDVGSQFQWSTAQVWRGRQAASLVGGHTLSVMKAGKHHEHAWRFAHWFTAPQQIVEFNAASVTLPPWKSAQ